jgi:hypothetical protein
VSDLPELKFDDEQEKDDLPALSFDDTVPADAAPEVTTKPRLMERIFPKGEAVPDAEFNKLRPDPKREMQDIADWLAAMRKGAPGYGLAVKAADLIRPGAEAEQKKADAERAARNPGVESFGNAAGGVAAPNIGGGFLTRILGNAGLAAGDAATRADSLADAKEKGLEAGATAVGIQTLLGTLGATGRGLKGLAERRATKAFDPTLAQQQSLNDKGLREKLGREMLDSGVVRFGSGVEGMAPHLEDMLSEKGRRIGAIRDAADQAGAKVDMKRLVNMGEMQREAAAATNEAGQSMADSYLRNAQNFAKQPTRSLKQAQEEIMSLNEQIPFKKPFAERTPSQQAFSELRSDLVQQMDDQIASRRPDLAQENIDTKKLFGLFKEGDAILDKSVARQARNADFGLRDMLAATQAEGGLKKGAMALASKVARERGNSSVAVLADKMSKLMGANPSGFGKYLKPLKDAAARGNQALMATHLLLMKDPEYVKTLEDADDGSP